MAAPPGGRVMDEKLTGTGAAQELCFLIAGKSVGRVLLAPLPEYKIFTFTYTAKTHRFFRI